MNEQHAESVSAAVPRDDRARDRFHDFVKIKLALHHFPGEFHKFGVGAGMGDEAAGFVVDGIRGFEFLYVGLDAHRHFSAIFFLDAELPVFHVYHGMNLQNIGAVHFHFRTSPALIEIFQPIGHKRGVHASAQRVYRFFDLRRALARVP